MANTIRLKSGSGNNPSASDLVVGEVALRTDGNPKLFTKNDAGNVLEVGLVESGSIVAGSIVNADINASAAIAGTKISPNFGSQNVQTSGYIQIQNTNPTLHFTDTDNDDDFSIMNRNGLFVVRDETDGADRFTIGSDGTTDITGNLDVGAGLDVTGASTFSGGITSTGNLTLSSTTPQLYFTDTDHNPDYAIWNHNGILRFLDVTNSNATRLEIQSSGLVKASNSFQVTGNILVSGLVDGVDIATRDTLFGGLTSSSGVLSNGVIATTQSAGDNSTKVATTAYTDTAISNLVDSSPSTLNTLNELAAALGDDANFSTTVTNSIATKMPIAGGTFSGAITVTGDVDSTTGIFERTTGFTSQLKFNLSNETQLKHLSNGQVKLSFVGYQNAARGSIDAQSGFIQIKTAADETGIICRDNSSTDLYFNGTKKLATSNTGVTVTGTLIADGLTLYDNEKLLIGTNTDIEVFHDGTNSIFQSDTGDLQINSGNSAGNVEINLNNNVAGNTRETSAKFIKNGAVELYYDNSKKFETTSAGVSVTGQLSLTADLNMEDGDQIEMGTDNDFKIFHSGFNYIESHNDVEVHINAYTGGSAENMAKFKPNGAVELYYDNSKKFETTSGGVQVTDNLNMSGGHIFLADNYKLNVGTGDDLQLYHDGSHSYLDNNTGSFRIRDAGGAEKLKVHGTGVTVTGTCTATTFSGSGASLTNIPAGQLTGTLPALDGSNLTGLTVNNANTLDNLDSTQFLRSDTTDTFTGNEFTFSSSADQKIILQGASNPYIRFKEGTTNKAYIQWHSNGNFYFVNQESGEQLFIGSGSNGLTFHHNGTNSSVIHLGNDGSGSGLDADTIDGLDSVKLYRQISSASATVGPGWMTVAENTSGREHGEIIVSDQDSSDHGFIRIDWMRSYNDSCFTVINCGGHSNRITGVRVLRDSNTTYGNKKLQVYVTTSSTYSVQINQLQNQGGWTGHTVVTPVIQATISGYVTQGQVMESLDDYNFAAEDGIQAGAAGIKSNGKVVLGTHDYQLKDGNNNRNMYFLSGETSSGSDIGISGYNGAGEWRFQLYGASGNYGFLDANWASWDIKKAPSGAFYVDEGAGLQRVWNQGNDGSGSGLDADTVDGLDSAAFLRSNATDSASGSISFTNSYYEFGNSTGSVSNDGSWDARLNLAGSNHARLDVKSVSNGIITTLYSHTGHTSGKVGTRSNHHLSFIVNSNTRATLTTAGSLDTTVQGTLWGASNDGSGSGLDADVLRGIGGQKYLASYNDATGGWEDSNRNFRVTTGGGAAGLVFHESDGTFAFQIYGDGSAQGFLTYNWGTWDLRKYYNGQLYLRVSDADYLAFHAGNDGSGSGLDSDTVDNIHGTSLLRSDANDNWSGTLTNNSRNEDPTTTNGAINLQPSTSGGRTGIVFRSKVNNTSDFAYVWYYDDLDPYRTSGNSSENGCLLIGIQNDAANASSSDFIAIEASGDIFLNPGIGTGIKGANSWNSSLGNVYVGNAATKYKVLHAGNLGDQNWNFTEGITLGTTAKGIKFGAGTAANDDAHIEWLGGNNDGRLRISTSDDNGTERIEFGDYDTTNKGGSFEQWSYIKRSDYYVNVSSTIDFNAHGGGMYVYRSTTGGGIIHFQSNVGGTNSLKSYINESGSLVSASDYRLKTDVAEITNGTELVKNLKPSTYKWKHDTTTTHHGFIAHELQEVLPNCVDGDKDQMKDDNETPHYQFYTDQELIPVLTAALKEAIARIEDLESKVNS